MNVTIGLTAWVVQLIATVGMLLAAFIEIEWIMAAGPLLSISGLLMAISARRCQSVVVLSYGLSGPMMCALCATLIAVNSWGPEESRLPIGAIIIVYAILAVPLAIVAFLRIRRPPGESTGSPPRVWQFSLRSMLVLMTVVCVLIVVAQFFIRNVSRDESYLFGSYALAWFVLSAIVAWRFFAMNMRRSIVVVESACKSAV